MKKIILIGSEGVLGNFYKKKLKSTCDLLVVMDLKAKNVNSKKFISKKIDISDEREVEYFFKNLKKRHKNIDVIINNAAFSTEFALKKKIKLNKDFVKFDTKTWNEIIQTNLTAVFYTCRLFFKYFHNKKKLQKIINIGSIYGSHSPHHHIYENQAFFSNIAYTSSKSGLIGLTKWLATKYAKENTNVNLISPSGVYNKQNSKFVKKYLELIPYNRMAKPSDIFGIVDFLISDKSNYITGQNLFVDGGFSSW